MLCTRMQYRREYILRGEVLMPKIRGTPSGARSASIYQAVRQAPHDRKPHVVDEIVSSMICRLDVSSSTRRVDLKSCACHCGDSLKEILG